MRLITLIFGLLLSFSANAQTSKPVNDLARGELLYTTHCVACHAIEIHWRAKKLVSNWNGLKMQVNRWQKSAALGWGADDIEQVSLYLNATYYHFSDANRIGLGYPDAKAD